MDSIESNMGSSLLSQQEESPRKLSVDEVLAAIDASASKAMHLAYMILGSRVLSEEAVQEATLSVWRRVTSSDQPITLLVPYYLRAVQNAALTIARRRSQTVKAEIERQAIVAISQGMPWEVCYEKLQLLQDFLDVHHRLHAETLSVLLASHGNTSSAAAALGLTDAALRGRFRRMVAYVRENLVAVSIWLGEDFRDDGDGTQPARRRPKGPISDGPTQAPLPSTTGRSDGSPVRQESERAGSDAPGKPPESSGASNRDFDDLLQALKQLESKVLYELPSQPEMPAKLPRTNGLGEALGIQFELALAKNEVFYRAHSFSEAHAIVLLLDSVVLIIDQLPAVESTRDKALIEYARIHLKALIRNILRNDFDETTENAIKDSTAIKDPGLGVIDFGISKSDMGKCQDADVTRSAMLLPNDNRSSLFSWAFKMSQARVKHEETLNLLAALYRLLPEECEKVFKCWNDPLLEERPKLSNSPDGSYPDGSHSSGKPDSWASDLMFPNDLKSKLRGADGTRADGDVNDSNASDRPRSQEDGDPPGE